MSGWLDLVRAVAPTLAQGGSLTRAGIQGIGGSLLATGAASGQIPVMAIGGAMWLGAAAWGLFRHTDASVADAAGQLRGVNVVVDGSRASPAVVSVAKDKQVPGVTLAR